MDVAGLVAAVAAVRQTMVGMDKEIGQESTMHTVLRTKISQCEAESTRLKAVLAAVLTAAAEEQEPKEDLNILVGMRRAALEALRLQTIQHRDELALATKGAMAAVTDFEEEAEAFQTSTDADRLLARAAEAEAQELQLRQQLRVLQTETVRLKEQHQAAVTNLREAKKQLSALQSLNQGCTEEIAALAAQLSQKQQELQQSKQDMQEQGEGFHPTWLNPEHNSPGAAMDPCANADHDMQSAASVEEEEKLLMAQLLDLKEEISQTRDCVALQQLEIRTQLQPMRSRAGTAWPQQGQSASAIGTWQNQQGQPQQGQAQAQLRSNIDSMGAGIKPAAWSAAAGKIGTRKSATHQGTHQSQQPQQPEKHLHQHQQPQQQQHQHHGQTWQAGSWQAGAPAMRNIQQQRKHPYQLPTRVVCNVYESDEEDEGEEEEEDDPIDTHLRIRGGHEQNDWGSSDHTSIPSGRRNLGTLAGFHTGPSDGTEWCSTSQHDHAHNTAWHATPDPLVGKGGGKGGPGGEKGTHGTTWTVGSLPASHRHVIEEVPNKGNDTPGAGIHTALPLITSPGRSGQCLGTEPNPAQQDWARAQGHGAVPAHGAVHEHGTVRDMRHDPPDQWQQGAGALLVPHFRGPWSEAPPSSIAGRQLAVHDMMVTQVVQQTRTTQVSVTMQRVMHLTSSNSRQSEEGAEHTVNPQSAVMVQQLRQVTRIQQQDPAAPLNTGAAVPTPSSTTQTQPPLVWMASHASTQQPTPAPAQPMPSLNVLPVQSRAGGRGPSLQSKAEPPVSCKATHALPLAPVLVPVAARGTTAPIPQTMAASVQPTANSHDSFQAWQLPAPLPMRKRDPSLLTPLAPDWGNTREQLIRMPPPAAHNVLTGQPVCTPLPATNGPPGPIPQSALVWVPGQVPPDPIPIPHHTTAFLCSEQTHHAYMGQQVAQTQPEVSSMHIWESGRDGPRAGNPWEADLQVANPLEQRQQQLAHLQGGRGQQQQPVLQQQQQTDRQGALQQQQQQHGQQGHQGQQLQKHQQYQGSDQQQQQRQQQQLNDGWTAAPLHCPAVAMPATKQTSAQVQATGGEAENPALGSSTAFKNWGMQHNATGTGMGWQGKQDVSQEAGQGRSDCVARGGAQAPLAVIAPPTTAGRGKRPRGRGRGAASGGGSESNDAPGGGDGDVRILKTIGARGRGRGKPTASAEGKAKVVKQVKPLEEQLDVFGGHAGWG